MPPPPTPLPPLAAPTNFPPPQAEEAGRKLRSLLRPSDTLHFFTSPYRRTRETTSAILSSLTSATPTPSPFPRSSIKVYEEPRLREQDFGNFQPCSADMERMWRERADYGHFFYRIPNGESAADAYDRVSGFNESLWRSFGEEGFASVCVLVTHGLMTRVFLMKWFHFSVEYFEDLRNVDHCEFVVMKRSEGSEGKFVLQNQLRTWSELKREKARALKGEVEEGEVPVRRTWAGCLDGSELTRPPQRKNTADLFMNEVREDAEKEEFENKHNLPHHHHQHLESHTYPDATNGNQNGTDSPLNEQLDYQQEEEEHHTKGRSPSPSTTPSALPPIASKPTRIPSPQHLPLLEIGRDGGGSRSGAASRSGSLSRSASNDSDERAYHDALGRQGLAVALTGALGRSAKGRARADVDVDVDVLGDWSADEDEDEGGEGAGLEGGRRGGSERRRGGGDVDVEMSELERRERHDRSLRGSVY